MIAQISRLFVKLLSKFSAFEPSREESEIYQYGFEITISSILNLIIVAVMGMIFNSILSSAIFVCEFYLVRRYTGGYHAENYYICNIVFGLTYTCVAVASFLSKRYSIFTIAIIFLALVGTTLVWKLSPVPNKHKILTDKQKKKIHDVAIIRYLIVLLIGCLTLWYNMFYGGVILSTLVAIDILILVSSVHKKEVYKNEY